MYMNYIVMRQRKKRGSMERGVGERGRIPNPMEELGKSR